MHTISLVQNRATNPDLEMEGVVFTMYDARTNLSLSQVVENVKENLKQTVYKTIIPRNVRLAEAPKRRTSDKLLRFKIGRCGELQIACAGSNSSRR